MKKDKKLGGHKPNPIKLKGEENYKDSHIRMSFLYFQI